MREPAGRERRAAPRPPRPHARRGCCRSRARGRRAARSSRSAARSGRLRLDIPRAGTSSAHGLALRQNCRRMGHALVAYLAAALVAASHTAAPPQGRTTAFAARPVHGSIVLRARPDGRPLVRVGPRAPLGGPLVFGVVAVRGRWVAVTSEALPNGHFGWAELGRDVSLERVRWKLRAS